MSTLYAIHERIFTGVVSVPDDIPEHLIPDYIDDQGFIDTASEVCSREATPIQSTACRISFYDQSKADWDKARLMPDWKYEVANGDTILGYEDWLSHRIES